MTFGEVLSEMQGLLGEEIIVAVLSYRTDERATRQQMHALFGGRLRRSTDESELKIVSDDGIAFVIGESEKAGDFSKVYLAEDSFRDAWRDDEGQLVIVASDAVVIQIARTPTRPKETSG